MRISKTLAVAASACALATAVAIPATAGAAHHPSTGKHGTFSGKITPKSGIKSGTKVTLKAKGAEKKTSYICLFAIVKGKANGPNIANSTHSTSTSKGTFSCSLTFQPFTEPVGGKTVHCPPTKAEKKAGYICGFAAADPANSQKSNTFQYLNFA